MEETKSKVDRIVEEFRRFFILKKEKEVLYQNILKFETYPSNYSHLGTKSAPRSLASRKMLKPSRPS